MLAPSSRMPPCGPRILSAPRARLPARVTVHAGTQVDMRLSASLCAVALASEHGAPRPLPVPRLATRPHYDATNIPVAAGPRTCADVAHFFEFRRASLLDRCRESLPLTRCARPCPHRLQDASPQQKYAAAQPEAGCRPPRHRNASLCTCAPPGSHTLTMRLAAAQGLSRTTADVAATAFPLSAEAPAGCSSVRAVSPVRAVAVDAPPAIVGGRLRPTSPHFSRAFVASRHCAPASPPAGRFV